MLYNISQNNNIVSKAGGDHIPFDKREVSYRNFVFHLKTVPGVNSVYYMRIKTSSSLNLPLWVLSSTSLTRKISNEQLLLGLYYGLILVIIFYNMFIFFATRDLSYLYYIFWVLCFGLYQATLNGLSFQYFWPNSIEWANTSMPFFIFSGASWGIIFGKTFLRIKENNPVLNKIYLSLLFITIPGIVLSFILPYTLIIKIAAAFVILLMLFMMIAGIIRLANGFRAARYFIIAWTTLIIGVIVYSIKTFGFLPINFFTNWSQQIGSALEVTLLSLALADRINIAEREKEKAEVETVETRKKYKLLFEGSSDIIFTLDENWKFLTVNHSINNHLKIRPNDVIGKKFIDIIYNSPGRESMMITKNQVNRILEQFSKERKPANFKTQFILPMSAEPKEMQVSLEYINIEGKDEILGKASNVPEDILMKFFDCEKQKFTIGNYIMIANDLSLRATRNLVKYIEPRQITIIRIALREIIINSIEHGNLNISYEEKSKSLTENNYFDFLTQRQMDPAFMDKKVEVRYSIESDKVTYKVTDEGEGFDHKNVIGDMSGKANTELLSHGRGISMANNIFDEIKYNDKGNEVTLVKYYN